jgi:hypothetical protein
MATSMDPGAPEDALQVVRARPDLISAGSEREGIIPVRPALLLRDGAIISY